MLFTTTKPLQGKDAQMEHANGFTRQLATTVRNEFANHILDRAWEIARPLLLKALCDFLAQTVSPTVFYQLENLLSILLRSFGCSILESLLNSLEPAASQQMQ